MSPSYSSSFGALPPACHRVTPCARERAAWALHHKRHRQPAAAAESAAAAAAATIRTTLRARASPRRPCPITIGAFGWGLWSACSLCGPPAGPAPPARPTSTLTWFVLTRSAREQCLGWGNRFTSWAG
eukprot:scaffold269_cov404-Prasinococcus_capsulatus_cf.AAC.41